MFGHGSDVVMICMDTALIRKGLRNIARLGFGGDMLGMCGYYIKDTFMNWNLCAIDP